MSQPRLLQSLTCTVDKAKVYMNTYLKLLKLRLVVKQVLKEYKWQSTSQIAVLDIKWKNVSKK